MVQGYCPKCKVKREIPNVKYQKTSNGRTRAWGLCPKCGCNFGAFIADKANKAGGKKSRSRSRRRR